jgi:23S rRNA (guanosine2251-2'-O)-methyltransferase
MKTPSQSIESVFISGTHGVWEALQGESSGQEELLIARKAQYVKVQQILDQARKKGIPVRYVSKEALTSLVGHDQHQGLVLRGPVYEYAPFDALVAQEKAQIEPLLVLDCIQDPQNLGAILRSACFFGARSVIIPKDRAAAVTSAVIKVAAGATTHTPVIRVTNLARSLEQLKDMGLWIIGLDPQGPHSIYQVDLSVPLGLVVGNEEKGLRPLTRQNCDTLAKIPRIGLIPSLNAAAASAIALAELQRQRMIKS